MTSRCKSGRGDRQFRRLKRGEPFFFKLRAPHRAIAGFGFFERYESLPAWLAWDSFGEMNGAADFDSMIERIVRLRGDDPTSARAGDFQIGCIMIAATAVKRLLWGLTNPATTL